MKWSLESSERETLKPSPREGANVASLSVVGSGALLSDLRRTAVSAVIACAGDLGLAATLVLRAGPWFTPSAEARAIARWRETRSVGDVALSRGEHDVVGPVQYARGSLYALWCRASESDVASIDALLREHREGVLVFGEGASFDIARFANPAWFECASSQAIFPLLAAAAAENGEIVARSFGEFDDREGGVELAGARKRLAQLQSALEASLGIR